MRRWTREWLVQEADGERRIPAYTFLKSIPATSRGLLLAIVDAVAATGPDQGFDQNTHRAMKGEIKDLHEARDRQGQTLYRLFLLWQRRERRVVIIDGREKPNNTALAEAEYRAIAELAARIANDPPPFATANDFIRLDLESE
jgi:hypothetical protein